jgi:hypothetical protein
MPFLHRQQQHPPTPTPQYSTTATTALPSWSSLSTTTAAALQLFAVTPLEMLMVNSVYTKDPQHLPHYDFLGRVVGKAVYESILVEARFLSPFLNTMLGKSNTLEDLKKIRP